MLPFSDNGALAWWNYATGKLRRNGSTLLNNGVTQKHGHDILIMIKQSILINITEAPNLS